MQPNSSNKAISSLATAVPKDLIGDLKLQALARKNHIEVTVKYGYNGYGKTPCNRMVTEKDYTRWCDIVSQYRAEIDAKKAKRIEAPRARIRKAIVGTDLEKILDSLDPAVIGNEFGQMFFDQIRTSLGSSSSGLDVAFKAGKVHLSAVKPVKMFGITATIKHQISLSLPIFAGQFAKAKSIAECDSKWSKAISLSLNSLVLKLQASVSDVHGFELLSPQECHHLLINDNSFHSTDLDNLRDRIVKAARLKYEETLARDLASRHPAFSSYLQCFPKARKMKRRIIAYLGPTNSGKTFAAVKQLVKAKSGVYLGPLRLLALEQKDAIEELEVRCSLITGEESIISVWQKTTLFQKCIRKQIEVYNIHLSLNIKTTLFFSPPGFLSKIHRFGAHLFRLIN